MADFPFDPPLPLSSVHQTGEFDCGKAALNDFLCSFALANTPSGNSRTFVVADANHRVVGFYSLAATGIVHDAAPT